MEDLAFDRAPLERIAGGRLQLVETRAEKRVQARRHLSEVTASGYPGRELLGEERIARGRLRDPRPCRCRRVQALEQRVDVGAGKRRKPQSDRPCRIAVEQLRAGGAHEKYRRVNERFR